MKERKMKEKKRKKKIEEKTERKIKEKKRNKKSREKIKKKEKKKTACRCFLQPSTKSLNYRLSFIYERRDTPTPKAQGDGS